MLLYIFLFVACREAKNFKVIVVMPLLPAFEGRSFLNQKSYVRISGCCKS